MNTRAYFENIQAVLLQQLKRAEQSIHIAVAWFTETELLKVGSAKIDRKGYTPSTGTPRTGLYCLPTPACAGYTEASGAGRHAKLLPALI